MRHAAAVVLTAALLAISPAMAQSEQGDAPGAPADGASDQGMPAQQGQGMRHGQGMRQGMGMHGGPGMMGQGMMRHQRQGPMTGGAGAGGEAPTFSMTLEGRGRTLRFACFDEMSACLEALERVRGLMADTKGGN
jgi:hypothetical protein